MKLAIIGSRTFDDYDTVLTTINALFEQVANDKNQMPLLVVEQKAQTHWQSVTPKNMIWNYWCLNLIIKNMLVGQPMFATA